MKFYRKSKKKIEELETRTDNALREFSKGIEFAPNGKKWSYVHRIITTDLFRRLEELKQELEDYKLMEQLE